MDAAGDSAHAGAPRGAPRRANRRKCRALAAGAAAALVLVGGGVLATDVAVGGNAPHGPDAPVVADAPAQELAVQVRVGVPRASSTVLGDEPGRRAAWDAQEGTLTFVPDMDYSSSCPPTGTARATASEAVTLTVRDDTGSKICTLDARQVTVTIDGLANAPAELTVSASGRSTTVPVVPVTGGSATVCY